jgi:hypothetical protein
MARLEAVTAASSLLPPPTPKIRIRNIHDVAFDKVFMTNKQTLYLI